MFREVTDDGAPESVGNSKKHYAVLDVRQVEALSHAMPDAQSAVLLCLAWHAARQSRLQLGECAGQFVARLSGQELANMTGRALRTVRYALKALRQNSLIDLEPRWSRRKSAYRVNLTAFEK